MAERYRAGAHTEYVQGDEITLDEAEATRLGNAGGIAPVGTKIVDEAERERHRKLAQADALDIQSRRLREEAGES